MDGMNIWIDENIPMGREIFGLHGRVTAFAGRSLKRSEIRDADALIVRSVTRVDRSLLKDTRIRFVATATIGTDHVDLAALAERGIGFASAARQQRQLGRRLCGDGPGPSGANGPLVAARQNPGHCRLRQRGQARARSRRRVGMRVVKCDPPLRALSTTPEEYLDLDELLACSDAVSLHVPLVLSGPHATLRLADAGFFARLARPILFINTSRGDAVDESALLAAAQKGAGKVEAMVLDVFAGEPRIDPAVCAGRRSHHAPCRRLFGGRQSRR